MYLEEEVQPSHGAIHHYQICNARQYGNECHRWILYTDHNTSKSSLRPPYSLHYWIEYIGVSNDEHFRKKSSNILLGAKPWIASRML